jgi:hypothetical protein
MVKIDLTLSKGAIFSDDGKFRYVLWRSTNGMTLFENNSKMRLQIGLNPSKAGVEINDPTIERGVRRADVDGFGIFVQTNLYAYTSTDPKELLKGGYYIGEENDAYIKQMINLALSSGGQIVCAWGSFPPVFKRAPEVLKMIPEAYCLGINQDGQPKHPLYVGYDVPMVKYVLGLSLREKK